MAKKTNTNKPNGAQENGAKTAKPEASESTEDQVKTTDEGGDAEFEWSITFAMNLLEVCRVTSFDDLDGDRFAEIEGIWTQAACDQFSPSLALAMFDTALDQGAEIAKLLLQKAVGVKADRDIGAKTQAAIAELAEGEVIDLLLAYRPRRAAFAGNAHTDMMPRGRRVLKLKDAIHAMKVEGGEDQDGLG